jgi:hypothetical protein
MPFVLSIAEGTGRGRRFRFAADSVAIGRGPENDVVLNDAAVSRAHARIERRGAAWVLLDRSSANGTQLNGAVLAAAAALRDGDRIRVGAVTFEFRGQHCRALAAAAGRSRSKALAFWTRLRPPARAGLIAGCALVAVAGSGAASWRSGPAKGEEPDAGLPRASPPASIHDTGPDRAPIGAARAAYERGRRKLEERRIAPRNLYDAWRAFEEARSHLEGVDLPGTLWTDVVQAIRHCERELERQCRGLLFQAARFERYGEEARAQQIWRDVLKHFPGDETTGCRKKARDSLISPQPEEGE